MILWQSNDFALYYIYMNIPVILSIVLPKQYPYLSLLKNINTVMCDKY